MPLVQFLRLLYRRRLLLVIVPLVAAGLATWLTSMTPREYQASASIQVNMDAYETAMDGSRKSLNNYEVRRIISDIMALLESRKVISMAGWDMLLTQAKSLAQEDETGEPTTSLPDGRLAANPLPTVMEDWQADNGGDLSGLATGLDGLDPTQQALAAVQSLPEDLAAFLTWAIQDKASPYSYRAIDEHIKISQVASASIVSIQYTSASPVLAALTIHHVIQAFALEQSSQRNSEATGARAFFEEQTDLARKKLAQAESSLKAFRSENNISNFYEQTKALSVHMIDVRLLGWQAQQDASAAEAEAARIEVELADDGALLAQARNAVDDAVILRLVDERAAQRVREDMTRILNGEDLSAPRETPGIDRNELDEALDAHFKSRLTGIGMHKSELVMRWLEKNLERDAALAGARQMDAYLDELIRENSRFAILGSEVSRLDRQAGVNENEFLSLLHSLNQARLFEQQLSHTESFRLLDPVLLPDKPVSSRRAMVVALSAVATWAVLVGFLLLAAWFDQSLYLPSRIEKVLGVAVWGGIPHVERVEKRPDEVDLRQATILGRILATTTGAMMQSLGEGRRLQVVGNRLGCGKSTAARMLAWNLRELGQRVRLVRLGRPDPDDPDTIAIDPDLGQGARLGALREALESSTARYTIVDQPDMSRSSLALDLAELVDASLFVLHSGHVYSQADSRALHSLELSGAPTLGLLINGITYEAVEEIMGEVPIRRSALRKTIKRLLLGRFKVKQGQLPDNINGQGRGG